MQAEDVEFAAEWSDRALKLMAEHGVPPALTNHSVWFRYASGRLPELNKEIDERIENNEPVDLDTTASCRSATSRTTSLPMSR